MVEPVSIEKNGEYKKPEVTIHGKQTSWNADRQFVI